MRTCQYENIPDRDLDPPEGHVVPEGLEMFNQLPHDTADELFMDEWADLDREFVLTVLQHCLRPNADECDIGKNIRIRVLDLATRAGNNPYAKEVYRDQMGAI